MAKPSDDVFDGRLPIWLNVETDMSMALPSIRVTLRCIDGDVRILDGEFMALAAAGRSDRYAFKKRAVLERCRDLISTQLGILALEEN
tara:strand:+ start:1944 stop:2207 length:264 start_codon:yes stop_codon:yes gene_type:complete